MRLFIETLMVLLEKENLSQTNLVDLCNKNGAKEELRISKGAISNYKQGRFPEPAYAALIIRNVSNDASSRNELAIAYLRDVANELGLDQGEIDIVNLRKKTINQLQSLPVHLRDQLTTLGQAAVKVNEFRAMVEKLSALAARQLSPPKPTTPRGMKRQRRK